MTLHFLTFLLNSDRRCPQPPFHSQEENGCCPAGAGAATNTTETLERHLDHRLCAQGQQPSLTTRRADFAPYGGLVVLCQEEDTRHRRPPSVRLTCINKGFWILISFWEGISRVNDTLAHRALLWKFDFSGVGVILNAFGTEQGWTERTTMASTER
jgi:hypothetical protein